MNFLSNLLFPITAIAIVEVLKKVCDPKSYLKKILMIVEIYLVLAIIYIPLRITDEYKNLLYIIKKTYPTVVFSTIPLAIVVISIAQLVQYSKKIDTSEKKEIVKKSRIIVCIIIATCIISTVVLVANWGHFDKLFH